MAHKSENIQRLQVSVTQVADFENLPAPDPGSFDVWLFVLPFGRRLCDDSTVKKWLKRLEEFARSIGPDSVLAVLTSPEDAAQTWPALSKVLRFQLWVAIKLDKPINAGETRLPEHHAAMLVLSRYQSSLRHTKTRIAYTYCPACDKTTKDYGGKKHTYHEYGTLMSDVWRDFDWSPGRSPEGITDRLADLFGVDPHRTLNVIDLTSDIRLQPNSPARIKKDKKSIEPSALVRQFESRLACGDCLETLMGIPDNSVDFCFADPPYNLSKRYDKWDDSLDIVEYFNWCDRWLSEMGRILRDGCTCAVLNIPQWAIRHFSHMRSELRFQNWIVWEGLSLPVRMVMPAHYSIICFSKGLPRPLPGMRAGCGSIADGEALSPLRESYCLRASCVQYRRLQHIEDRGEVTDLWWDIHRLKHNSRRVDHPCQLPPVLMRRLIAVFTHPDEVVLDPFNGAGTTSLCAEAMGRRFIGIELSRKYHDLATQRHELFRKGSDPFAKATRIPSTKNNTVKRIGNVVYEVPKKVLQLEVRQIARTLGRLPSRQEVERLSKYPIRYFDEYFLSWGEVCAAARTTGMTETRERNTKSESPSQPTLFGHFLAAAK